MPELYISTDIETDGPIPGPHSMLSLGSAAYTAGKQLLGTFSANLETLPGASAHPFKSRADYSEGWAESNLSTHLPPEIRARHAALCGIAPRAAKRHGRRLDGAGQ